MLITYQIPFADTRQFATGAVPPLSVPGWPIPEYEEFVRCFGGIVDRAGFQDWIPEPRVCNAHRAVRLNGPVRLPIKMGRRRSYTPVEFMPVSRRLFFDGRAMGKLELVFRPRKRSTLDLTWTEPEELVRAFGDTGLVAFVPGPDGIQKQFATMSTYHRLLPRQWLAATTEQNLLSEIEAQRHLVTAGTPMILITTSEVQHLPVPDRAKSWRIVEGNGDSQQTAAVAYGGTNRVGGRGTYWHVAEGSNSRGLERSLRITLLRLHAESTALRQVIKYIASPGFDVPPRSGRSNLLELYLHNAALGVLKLTDEVGQRNTGILSWAHRVYAESTPGERELVLDRLRNQVRIRGNYFRNLQEAISDPDIGHEIEETPAPAAAVAYFDDDDLRAIGQALLQAGIYSEARILALFAGVNPLFVANLPLEGYGSARLMNILNVLNFSGPLTSGETPMRVFLANAVDQTAPRIESLTFQEYLSELE